jgi:hypothetical protein
MLNARNDLPFGAQHLDCKIKRVKKENCGESLETLLSITDEKTKVPPRESC